MGHPFAPNEVPIVVGYAACVALSVMARQRSAGRDRLVWNVIIALVFVLGMNKFLDLQTDFTDYMRRLAREDGWYRERRAYQRFFVAALAVCGAAGTVALLALGWLNAAQRLAIGGVAILVTFILIRAASFHHIDFFLRETVSAVTVRTLIEASGLLVIGIGAIAAHRQPDPFRHTPPVRPDSPKD